MLRESLFKSFVVHFGCAAPDFATNNALHTKASLRTCRSPADQTTGRPRAAHRTEHVFHVSAVAARSRGARNAASFDHPRGLSEGTSTSAARPKPSRSAQSSICSRGAVATAAVVTARPEQRALVAVGLVVEPGHDALNALGRVAVRGPLDAAAGARLERRRIASTMPSDAVASCARASAPVTPLAPVCVFRAMSTGKPSGASGSALARAAAALMSSNALLGLENEQIPASGTSPEPFGRSFHPRHGFSKQSTPAAHLGSFGAGVAETTAFSRADAPRDERIPASGTSPRRPRRWSASGVGSVNVSANFVDFQRQTLARALSRAPNRRRRATEALR